MADFIGFDVFLSHNSADKPAVEWLANRLRAEVGLKVFLDKWNLVPGKPWQRELKEALNQSATVAVSFGPSGDGPWHHQEVQVALLHAVRTQDECRVVPVVLPGGRAESVTGFLALRTWVDFRNGLDDGEAFRRLVAGIKGEAIVTEGYTLPDEPAPYRGLLRFEKDDSRFFFGREADRWRLLKKLGRNAFVSHTLHVPIPFLLHSVPSPFPFRCPIPLASGIVDQGHSGHRFR